MNSSIWRRGSAVLVLAAAALIGSTVPAAADNPVACAPATVPVTLGRQSGVIAGTLCVPQGASTVELLVHGATYARYYWDLPYQPERYSHARAANQAGHATFAVDRLGVGESWHPFSTRVSYFSDAEVLAQVVQALRSGQLGTAFSKVVYVGHSFGSAVGLLVAGRYPGVDALVLTGFSHRPNYLALALKLEANFIPAVLDPKFRHSGYDLGYVTTRAGSRDEFYTLNATDPEVLVWDERLKQTAALLEGTFQFLLPLQQLDLAASQAINLPVLVLDGDQDPFFCGPLMAAACASDAALAAFERPYFGPGATVEGKILPGIGHNPSLQLVAPEASRLIIDFIDRHISP